MAVLSSPAARSALSVTAEGLTHRCSHSVLQRHLLRVVGHELRNPLGVAMGTVSRLLATGSLSAEQQRLLTRLESVTRRMTHLVEDLLDERLLEDGASMPVLPRLCDLRQLCEQASNDAAVLLAGGARRIRMEAQGDCHGEWDPLSKACVTSPEAVLPDLVTMNSTVLFEDEGKGEFQQVTLSYPKDARGAPGRVSVLAPVGIALLGLSQGQRVELVVPGGHKRRLRVVAVPYQPEAAGHFHL